MWRVKKGRKGWGVSLPPPQLHPTPSPHLPHKAVQLPGRHPEMQLHALLLWQAAQEGVEALLLGAVVHAQHAQHAVRHAAGKLRAGGRGRFGRGAGRGGGRGVGRGGGGLWVVC
jgi:hypothetical protein